MDRFLSDDSVVPIAAAQETRRHESAEPRPHAGSVTVFRAAGSIANLVPLPNPETVASFVARYDV